MTEEEEATRAALAEEFDRLEAEYTDADELPEEIDQRLGELEEMIEALDDRPVRYEPADIARAGVFVSLDRDGSLYIERGYVRPEDEAPAATATEGEADNEATDEGGSRVVVITVGGEAAESEDEPEDGGLRPLSDRLVAELTAHRTLALRDAVAQAPEAAFLSVLHALCLPAFYRFSGNGCCMEISRKSECFTAHAQGTNNVQVALILSLFAAWAARQDPATARPALKLLARDMQRAANEVLL